MGELANGTGHGDRPLRLPPWGRALSWWLAGMVLILLGLNGLWGTGQLPDSSAWWWPIPTFTLACLLLLFSHRRPILSLVGVCVIAVVDVFSGGSLAMLLVVVEAVFSATLHASQRAASILARVLAGVGVSLTAVVLILTGDFRMAVLASLQYVGIVATPYWWSISVRRSQELVRAADERLEDLRQLTQARQAAAISDERAAMAHDLHDTISGDVSALLMHSRSLAEHVRTDAHLATRADLISTLADTLMQRMGQMIRMLHSNGRKRLAPVLLSNFPDGTPPLTHELRIENTLPNLPVNVDQAFGRIAFEALVNAEKHQQPERTTIRWSSPSARLRRLDIHTRGTLLARPAPGTGFGVVALAERARRVGATFSAGPDTQGSGGVISGETDAEGTAAAPAGWRVTITIDAGALYVTDEARDDLTDQPHVDHQDHPETLESPGTRHRATTLGIENQ